MAKLILAFLLSFPLYGQDLFTQRCVRCHQKIGLPLKKIFFEYLLYYSSERRVKEAMRKRLLDPSSQKSIFGSKPPYRHKVNPDEIDILLQIYWNRYKVIGRLR